jgi:hypothetical protein
MPEQVTVLTQRWLGQSPYLLIEAVQRDPDPDDTDDDGLRLACAADGGGPIERAPLALMFLTGMPAEDNLLTRAVKDMIDEQPDHPDLVHLIEAMHTFAEYVGFPMPESGS